MIDLIKNFYKAKKLESANRVREQEMIQTFVSKAGNQLVETSSYDRDVSTWNRFINPNDSEKGHVEGDQRDMIRMARKMFRSDPFGRVVIQTMQNYLVGRGFEIKPKSDDPGVNHVWAEFWKSPRSKMRKKRFEIVTRFFRDGEVFLQIFSKSDRNVETGLSTVRFKDPLLCKNPATAKSSALLGQKELIRSGVEINPDDVEDVVAYWFEDSTTYGKVNRIEAQEIIHMKAFADSDQRRGESALQPIMPMISNYKNWLDNRIILNRMRSAIVLIKKITGTSTELQNLKGNMGPVNSAGQTVIRGGKILLANDGVDYKMESPNINASDVAEDGRNIKLAMAAGTNLPEYILGDASNANFASTLIAESPFVKAIEYWQIIFEEMFQELFRKVIENAVKAGKLVPPTDEEYLRNLYANGELKEALRKQRLGKRLTEQEEELLATGGLETPTEIFFGCDIQWPEITHRDFKALVEALTIARQQGWVADDTAAGMLGLDYNEEVRKQMKIEERAAENGDPLRGIDPAGEQDDDEMDNEVDDVLNQIAGGLSDEERKMILTADDPRAIANMLISRSSNGNGNGGNQDGPGDN